MCAMSVTPSIWKGQFTVSGDAGISDSVVVGLTNGEFWVFWNDDSGARVPAGVVGDRFNFLGTPYNLATDLDALNTAGTTRRLY
jgi:hypothetical protein